MKKIIMLAAAVLALVSCGQQASQPTEVTMTKADEKWLEENIQHFIFHGGDGVVMTVHCNVIK